MCTTKNKKENVFTGQQAWLPRACLSVYPNNDDWHTWKIWIGSDGAAIRKDGPFRITVDGMVLWRHPEHE